MTENGGRTQVRRLGTWEAGKECFAHVHDLVHDASQYCCVVQREFSCIVSWGLCSKELGRLVLTKRCAEPRPSIVCCALTLNLSYVSDAIAIPCAFSSYPSARPQRLHATSSELCTDACTNYDNNHFMLQRDMYSKSQRSSLQQPC